MTPLVNFHFKTCTHPGINLSPFHFFSWINSTSPSETYKPLGTCKYTLTWVYGTTNTNAQEVPGRTAGIPHPHQNQKPGGTSHTFSLQTQHRGHWLFTNIPSYLHNPRCKPLWSCKYTLIWVSGTTNTKTPEVTTRNCRHTTPTSESKPGLPHLGFATILPLMGEISIN